MGDPRPYRIIESVSARRRFGLLTSLLGGACAVHSSAHALCRDLIESEVEVP
jgi:hypothetical protein